MTSIGKCPYEFLETFTVKDLQKGRLKYANLALRRLSDIGMGDPDVEHYAEIRIVPGITTHTAAITVALLPYGEVEYADTIAVDAQSWPGLLSAALAYITGALGHDVGDRAARRHAGRIAEWLTSVSAIHDENKEPSKE